MTFEKEDCVLVSAIISFLIVMPVTLGVRDHYKKREERMVAPIVHQECLSCEKEFVGPYPSTEDEKKCSECRLEGQLVIVRHLDPLPDLPPHLDYELCWCNEEEAEFVVVPAN